MTLLSMNATDLTNIGFKKIKRMGKFKKTKMPKFKQMKIPEFHYKPEKKTKRPRF